MTHFFFFLAIMSWFIRYSKFVVVLNAKKAETRRLREKVQALENQVKEEEEKALAALNSLVTIFLPLQVAYLSSGC